MLARILTELKLLQTSVGVIVLSAGVGNDVTGWMFALALTVALLNAKNGITILYVILLSLAIIFVPLLLYDRHLYSLQREMVGYNDDRRR